MDENMTENTGGTGYLTVQVTTAAGAIPLEGAAVTVRDGESGTVLYELRSDADGRTRRVSLSAPPRSISASPSVARPYALYGITVSLPLYESAVYENVPIFDGITAIQQATLIPTPENGYSGAFSLNGEQQFEGEEPTLWRG